MKHETIMNLSLSKHLLRTEKKPKPPLKIKELHFSQERQLNGGKDDRENQV